MSNFRAITVPIAFLAALAVTVTPATPALAATWTVVSTPNATTGQNLFIGADALSTGNVWAVGRDSTGRPGVWCPPRPRPAW